MISLSYFSQKVIKIDTLSMLSIYENMNSIQIMWVIVTCKKFTNCMNHLWNYIFQVFYNTNTLEMFLKWVKLEKNSKNK